MQGFLKSRKIWNYAVSSPSKALGEHTFAEQGTRRRCDTGAIWSPGNILRRDFRFCRDELSAKRCHMVSPGSCLRRDRLNTRHSAKCKHSAIKMLGEEYARRRSSRQSVLPAKESGTRRRPCRQSLRRHPIFRTRGAACAFLLRRAPTRPDSAKY